MKSSSLFYLAVKELRHAVQVAFHNSVLEDGYYSMYAADVEKLMHACESLEAVIDD